jgi:hypothetical protein
LIDLNAILKGLKIATSNGCNDWLVWDGSMNMSILASQAFRITSAVISTYMAIVLINNELVEESPYLSPTHFRKWLSQLKNKNPVIHTRGGHWALVLETYVSPKIGILKKMEQKI